jgi:protein-tyrosine phosphatase
MIDLHCHILPGVDDGARSLADSLAMARQAEQDGIRVVCATPHIRHDHDVAIAELSERVADLNDAIARAGIDVRVLTGGEVGESAALELDDGELDLVSLGGGGRWILLEPAPGPLSDALERVVAELARRGRRCIIAHPERHLDGDSAERLAALVRAGALLQGTAAHLLGPGAPALHDLAAAGLLHVLASDAHSARAGRPLRISPGLEALRAGGTLTAHLDWITRTAPAAVVAGRDVDPPFHP